MSSNYILIDGLHIWAQTRGVHRSGRVEFVPNPDLTWLTSSGEERSPPSTHQACRIKPHCVVVECWVCQVCDKGGWFHQIWPLSPYIGGEREKYCWNETKPLISDQNIDANVKGTFKWSKNLSKKGWKRRFLDRLGLLSFKLSHASLKLASLGLQLLELPPTGSFISQTTASQSVLNRLRLKLPFNRWSLTHEILNERLSRKDSYRTQDLLL